MGRFYKTASANPMDYMHRINAPLMERALQFNDQAITDEYSQGQLIDAAAGSFNRLTDDEDRANQISQEYSGKIDELSKSIAANPANWRNYSEPLRKLKQDLATNYKTGEISKIAANYTAYKTWKDTLNKSVEQWNKFGGKKGGVDPVTAQTYEKYYLNKWRQNGQGTNYKNGQYNTLHMDDVMANMNLKDEISKGLDKVKSDLRATESNDQKGMYIIHRGNSTETVSRQKLLDMAMGNLSPDLQTYMRDRQNVGLLHNIYGQDGNLINPISGFGADPAFIDKSKKLISQTRQADPKKADAMQAEIDSYIADQSDNIRYNPNSGLSDVFKGAIEGNTFLRQKNTESIKADPVALPMWMQGRREIQQGLTRAQSESHFQQGRTDKVDAATKAFERQKDLIELRKKAAQEVKATGKASPKTAAKAKDIHADMYINEVPLPDHDFITDIATGDNNSKNRVNEAVKFAIPATVQQYSSNKTEAPFIQEYVGYLNGRPASDALAAGFIQLQEIAGRYKKPVLPNSPGSTFNPLLNTLKKVGTTFNNKINEWYSEQNKGSDKIDTNGLTSEGAETIANTINNSTGGYFTIDEEGNHLPIKKVDKILGSVGGNSQSKLGYRAEVDGQPTWVFPDDKNPNVYNLNRSNILLGAADKKSAYYNSLLNEEVNNINTELKQGTKVAARITRDSEGKPMQDPSGLSNTITLGGEKYPAILHDDGTNKVTLKDPDGTILATFNNTQELYQFYLNGVKAHQEAAKQK